MRVKDGGSRSWLVRALILVWNNAQTEPPGFRAGAVSGNFPVRLTHGRGGAAAYAHRLLHFTLRRISDLRHPKADLGYLQA